MQSQSDRYRIEFQRRPKRILRRLPKSILQRLEEAIDALAEDPRPPGHTKLSGHDNLYRIRVGDWRIVYAIKDDVLIVLVVAIGSRGQVYRNL